MLIKNICYNQIPYCANYDNSSYTCLSCLSNYYLFNNYCNQYPNGCTSVNSQGNCTVCMQGYTLISGGLCQLNVDQKCTQYNLLSGKCLACIGGYYLDSNSNCQLIPNNCLAVTSSGICTGCASNYFLQGGICYKTINNCFQYSSNGQCSVCVTNFYLSNQLCYPYPSNCNYFNTTINVCTQCIIGYTLINNNCVIQNNSNCLYNAFGSNYCNTCQVRYFEYWINTTTGQVISTALMVSSMACQPYPDFCTNVDLYGNCISCCFASQLTNGKCVGVSTLRILNCDSFDPVNLICLQCTFGYSYCTLTAICVQLNLNCQTISGSTCTKCLNGFIMNNGNCIRSPPGMVIQSNNSIICSNGYYYSTSSQYGQGANGACYRNLTQLIKASAQSTVQYYFTSFQPGLNSANGQVAQSSQMWNPPTYYNNYISITLTTPQIIFGVEVSGSTSGYVTYYEMHFRNSANAPLICWNSCQKIQGNANGLNVSTLNLDQPIIAT